MGWVDLHVHLLPGVDDGAKTLDDAVAMASALARLGFSSATPSPHNQPQYPSFSVPLCEAKLEELRSALEDRGIDLALSLGAENSFLDEGLLPSLGTSRARSIGNSKALLVEAPYSSPLPALADLVFRMRLKGVTPVIAHPERCLEFAKEGRAAEAVRCGARLQLDLGSLIGRHGKPAERVAHRLLADGLYSVAATDAHSPLDLEAWVTRSLAALRQRGGEALVTQLLETGPRELLGSISDTGAPNLPARW